MTNKQQKKLLCVDDLRYAEYYQMQETFDDLYSKSRNGEIFQNLMPLILSRENILLAYRNIKSNGGSKTRGTDISNAIDGTPCAVKVACTVWSGGKLGDYFKELPITIKLAKKAK